MLTKLLDTLNGEEGHAITLPGTLASMVGAILLAVGAVNDQDVLTIIGAIKLVKELIAFIDRLNSSEDQNKATIIRSQAVNPSDNILANLTDEERDRMSDQDRAIFGLPPKSEASAMAEVTIRDETGRAEITQSSSSGSGAGISLASSGDF